MAARILARCRPRRNRDTVPIRASLPLAVDPVRRMPMLALWSWLWLPGACAVSDPDPEWIGRQEAEAIAVPEFAVPAALLLGIDAPLPECPLRRGDTLTFGLRLDDHGDVRDWYVRIAVVEPELEGPTVARVDASVHAADGALLGRDVLQVSVRALSNGLARACRGEGERPGDAAPSTMGFGAVPESMRATLALMNLLQVVRRSDVLFDVLYEVIDKPSWLSVLLHFGVRVSVAAHFDRARAAAPFATAHGEVPAWEVPLELKLNGAPALRSVVTVVDPDSPFGLGAGVVALRAFRPSDPEVTFTMRLLSARRATAP
jgi:hypothetical protein